MRARGGVGKHGVGGGMEEERERERHVLGLRVKKGMGVRTWLLIDVKGSARVGFSSLLELQSAFVGCWERMRSWVLCRERD
jgi:hypothetical protein